MGQKIWTFSDGYALEFDRGQFDEWCVYEIAPDGSRIAPRDVDYFRDLLDLSTAFGKVRVYEDFVRVFDASKGKVDKDSLEVVVRTSQGYGNQEELVKRLFMILHMGMVAENVKKNTRLGKRIKRLGVHYLILEGHPVDFAANFMRGMKWREIDALCRARGF
jgi:hypothetical protein